MLGSIEGILYLISILNDNYLEQLFYNYLSQIMNSEPFQTNKTTILLS